MLKLLSLQNFILVEKADIPFEMGLNIISGETGSGKSAVMQALKLIAGEKGDPKYIRHGCDKSIIEALFEIEDGPVSKRLEEAGIEFNDDGLIIRRELYLTQKSRSFINNRLCSSALLKELAEWLFDIASQHASQKLFSLEFHRNCVDTFGKIDREDFEKSFLAQVEIEKELNQLKSGEAKRLREIEICQREWEEIEEAKLKNGEDEELFLEYSNLATSEERASLVDDCVKLFPSVQLNKIKSGLEQLARMDGSLSSPKSAFDQALIEIEEVGFELRRYLNKIEFNPERMAHVDDRLKTISLLKKKYGPTVDDIQIYQKAQKSKLADLEGSDLKIEELEKEWERLKVLNDEKAGTLTRDRKEAAHKLEKKITNELRKLNMAKASFIVKITPQPRSKSGDDNIEFFFQPNAGDKLIAVKESASGGELARIMLAIKSELADSDSTTLIFDEIDANIGGETAYLVGKKLQEIGEACQVISITHFPQVAKLARHHLKIFKKEIKGRTSTFIHKLEEDMREEELSRMAGIFS